MISELYIQDIGSVYVSDLTGDYSYFEKIEQINETTFAGYRKGKVVQTWNIRYVIRVTYSENEN